MSRRTVWKSLLACILLFLVTSSAQSQGDRHDGTWWTTEKLTVKLPFIMGLFDGLDVGFSFSLGDGWTTPAGRACFEGTTTSYVEQSKKYLTGVAVGQVVDGLDSFYKDYRNRSIIIPNAVELVLRSIAGEDIEQLTIQYRRSPK